MSANPDAVDVSEVIVARLLELGFPIDTESEDCSDILRALDQAVIFKQGTTPAEAIAPITRMDALTLNCAEAELQGAMQRAGVTINDDDPLAETVRDMHELIQRLDPQHRCSVDRKLKQVPVRCPHPKRGAQ